MGNRKQILDVYGNPIRANDDKLEDLNLPPGVQALVETRINDAVDRLREHNLRMNLLNSYFVRMENGEKR